MSDKKIFFVSDFHLGAPYLKNRDTERSIVAFLDSIKHEASDIFLVGDILDYWFEYRNVVPRGFIRFFGKIAELSDAGIHIHWLIGNHDIWIFDYLPKELGIAITDGAIQTRLQNRNLYIAHGDDTSDETLKFKMLRSIFRNKLCQKLYSSIHPRWTIPFAKAWSSHSRGDFMYASDISDFDNESLVKFSRKYLTQHPEIDFFIFGHRHAAIDREIAPGKRIIILGDWITHFSFAEMHDGLITLKKWDYPSRKSYPI